MLIEDYIAVVYRDDKLVKHTAILEGWKWKRLQDLAAGGRVVILEAWTMGKCISN